MRYMFDGCSIFIGEGLENWDVSKVKDMYRMFTDCRKFDCDLSNWNVSDIANVGWMFNGCDNLTIPTWYS